MLGFLSAGPTRDDDSARSGPLEALANHAVLLEHMTWLATRHEEGGRDARHLVLPEAVHQVPEGSARRIRVVNAQRVERARDVLMHVARSRETEEGALAQPPRRATAPSWSGQPCI